jgi:hypothetical protein
VGRPGDGGRYRRRGRQNEATAGSVRPPRGPPRPV